jgi:hypothetical protein
MLQQRSSICANEQSFQLCEKELMGASCGPYLGKVPHLAWTLCRWVVVSLPVLGLLRCFSPKRRKDWASWPHYLWLHSYEAGGVSGLHPQRQVPWLSQHLSVCPPRSWVECTCSRRRGCPKANSVLVVLLIRPFPEYQHPFLMLRHSL